MATQIVQAPVSADHAATEPLSPAGQAAMHRIELALAAPEVVVAVTRYEVASHRTAELSAAMDSRDLTGAEFESLVLAQDVMAASQATLTAAGRLDLIAGNTDAERLAARYHHLSAVIDRLSSRESHFMSRADLRELHDGLGERADIYFALARAGQLHLIEVDR